MLQRAGFLIHAPSNPKHMKISDHIIGLAFLIPITAMLLISLKGVVTGGAEFSPGTFTYDAKDDRPANAKTTNR